MQRTDQAGDHADPAQFHFRPQHVAQARDATADFLAGLGLSPADPLVEDLVLIVSELVTNSVRHAGGVTSLRLRADRDHIRVTVHDASPHHPQLRTPDLTGEGGGFGWPLILKLAHQVTVQPRTGGGKAITVTMPR